MAEERPVLDRYRRLQLLGEGGTGQVWLVEDQLRPGVQLALKEVAEGSTERAGALQREFVLLSRMRHPALVEALELDCSPTDGLPRFTLEYVDGMSLAAAAAEGGPPFCLQMAAEALGVLGFLHDFALVHRDLKPDNLIVRRRPRLGCRLVLLDLGLAISGKAGELPTASGPAGTLPYMAPELFEGGAPSPQSDLYALGALWFEVVHGKPPFLPKADGDLTAFIEAVRSGRRSRPPLPDGHEEGFGVWIEELLSHDPARRPGGAREALARLSALTGSDFPVETATSRAARLASDPLPGRERECGKLRAMLDPEAGPRLIWLAGGAGSGKSRLLNWLRGEMILQGWQVIAPLPGLPGRLGGEAGAATLLRNLRAGTAKQATLLLLDEVEAADGRLISLMDRIAREGNAPALQVVAALRPGEVAHPLLRRLLEHTGTVPTLRRVDLKPLGKSGLRKLAERATGNRDLSEARLGWLLRASEGEPSIVESLLVEGTWETGGRARRSEVLDRSVNVRMGLLSQRALTLIEHLAILGPDIGEANLATFAGLPPEQARDALQEARRAGLAQDHEGRWSTTSRAVTELFLRRLKGGNREQLHLRAAEMLQVESAEENRAWKLARLWSEAARPELALAQAAAAARESLSGNDPSEAADRFSFALRLCAPDAPERRDLSIERAAALTAGGRHQEAADAFGAALQLENDGPASAELLGRQAHALVQAGRFPEARERAQEALDLIDATELPILGARAQKAMGVVLGRLGREAEAIPLLTASLELLREEGDLETVAEALQNRAACKSRLRQKDAGDDFHRAIDLYRELGLHGGELKSLVGLAVLQMRDGRLDRAGELLEKVRRQAVKHGSLDLQETALSKLASLAIEQGRLDQAISLGREALDQARHLGDQNRMMIDRCRLAEALVGCGMPAEAIDLLRAGLKTKLEEVEPDMVDFARMLLAQAMLEAPSANEQDIRALLDSCQQGFRRRRKIRPLLLTLVIEMEAWSRPGAGATFDPIRREYEALASSEQGELELEIRLRADLALAAALINRGDATAAAETAACSAELAGHGGLPAYRARGLALAAAALEQAGKMEQAEKSSRESGRLLEQAAGLIEDSVLRSNFMNRSVFQAARGSGPTAPRGDDRRLLALYEMIRAINSENDHDRLLETILDMALHAVSAERGMILLRESSDDAFTLRLARNLDKETEKDAEEYSRGIVAQAGAGRSVLVLDAGEDVRFRDLKSVSMYGIRSLMCVPLRSRNLITGTVYLDSRKEGRLFTQEDLRFIEAFADHAALALQNARERAYLELENRQLRTVAETRLHYGNLVGRSQAMQQVFQLIEKVAASELPVLIQGESGTGKELVARAIHFNGPRKRRIILSENCAAIPESLLESELFGHVRGAFTGAERDRQGLFEQADGGTLFLDEVGDMSSGMQARLLRALEEGEIRRVGGDRSVKVDVRVIAATHRDLTREVQEGRFREDLFYRLQVLAIRIPPLRERAEDIPLLVDHFLGRIAKERGRERPRIEGAIRAILERYKWPGNVRQLENVLQRLVLLAGEAPITRADLDSDASLRETLLGSAAGAAPSFSLDHGAREQLRMALESVGGHREKAARLLGISRATVYRKIKEFGLK